MATREPADGSVPTTDPGWPPPSTVLVLMFVNPAPRSVDCAWSADCPDTSGTATDVCSLPTTTATSVLPPTFTPGPGSEERIFPT